MQGLARHRRCIPGAREAREAVSASMRSRWRARRAPAPEAGLAAGRGLRASRSKLGNPARPPHSPLSGAMAEPPRTRPPRALWPRAPRRGPAWSPEAASPASSPSGTSPNAPRHPLTPAPCHSSEMSVTSPWPLTGRPGPPTPCPILASCPLIFALRARSWAQSPSAGPVSCLSHTGFPSRLLVAPQYPHPGVPHPPDPKARYCPFNSRF